MIKRIACRLPILFIVAFSYAQSPEMSVATVHYSMIQIVDTTQPNSPIQSNMVLYLGKGSSLFTSFDEIQYYERVKKSRLTNPDLKITGHTTYWGAPIYFLKDFKNNKLASVSSMMGNHYLTEEPIPEMKWEISSDTKSIEGYLCQKATTNFRGRAYEAWFCNKLPFNNGPWKLAGLPGLILEAYDTQKEIVWNFKSFEDTSHVPIEITLTTIKTTPKELWQSIEGRQTDAAKAASAGGMIVSTQTLKNGTPSRMKIYNNPIEKE